MSYLVSQESSLVGGVSQQAPHKRQPGQLEAMDNCWPSVVSGLSKRAPLRHIAAIDSIGTPSDVKLHAINRDTEERYLAVVQNGSLAVFNAETGLAYSIYKDTSGTAADFSYLDIRYPNLIDDPEDFSGFTLHNASTLAAVDTEDAGPLGIGLWQTLTYYDGGLAGFAEWRTAEAVSLGASERMAISVYVKYTGGTHDWNTFDRYIGLDVRNASLTQLDVGTFTIKDGVITADNPSDSSVEDLGGGVYRLKWETIGSASVAHIGVVLGSSLLGEGNWTTKAWGLQAVRGNAYTNLAKGTFPPYLKGRVASSIRVTSIADYTIFTNSTKTPSLDSGTTESAQTRYQWYVFVQEFFANSVYSVTVRENGTDYTVTANIAASPGPVGTDQVVAALDTALGATAFTGASGFYKSVWQILGSGSTTSLAVKVGDGLGDRAMVAFSDTIDDFTDLPTNFTDRRSVKVLGEPGVADDFWVKFQKDDGSGSGLEAGIWIETNEPGRVIGVDGSTMPHVLIRRFNDGVGTHPGATQEGETYFTFEQAPWADSTVGDDNSNAWPFYRPDTTEGEAIRDVFLFKGRLGFLCGDRVVLSDITDLWNFWKTTVRDLIDSDRIVITAAHPNVSVLTGAIPMDERLIVLSDQNQFIVQGQPTLTPSTAELIHTSSFESYPDVSPSASDNSAFIGLPRGNFATLLRYVPLTDGATFEGYDVGEQVPQYVPGPLREIACSSLAKAAFMLGSDSSALYFYKWFASGGNLVQSAWGKMTIDGYPCGLAFIQETLYVMTIRDSRVYLEAMTVMESEEDLVYLDHQLTNSQLTFSYSSGTNKTTVDFPHTDPWDGTWYVFVNGASVSFTYTDNSGVPRLAVGGDITASDVVIGKSYTMSFSPNLGPLETGDNKALLNAQKFITTLTVAVMDTQYFDLQITPFDGTAWTDQYRGDIHNSYLPRTGEVRFGVMMDPERGAIQFTNISGYNSRFQGLEWEISGFSRGTRL